jgi:hypothetical protein
MPRGWDSQRVPVSSLAICRVERLRLPRYEESGRLRQSLVGVRKIVPVSEGESLIANKRPPRLPGTSVDGRQIERYGRLGNLEPKHEQRRGFAGHPKGSSPEPFD